MSVPLQSSVCPRCGAELKPGFTATHKVCLDCPSCGGRLVTLPVLKEGLGLRGVATLTRTVREAEAHGCRCPTCGEPMRLLKVGVEELKIEIDVCAKCLSVWCDHGEFEGLVPTQTAKPESAPLREVDRRASREAQERLARVMLEKVPEDVSPSDITLQDVALDLIRLVVGAPTLWRTVRPVTPIFTVLLTLAFPIAHACAFYAWHTQTLYRHRLFGHSHNFWILDTAMIEAGGFLSPAAPLSCATWPFLQESGYLACILSMSLFPILAIAERRAGHARFLLLLGSLWLTALGAHLLQAAWKLQPAAYLCGFDPIALGLIAFLLVAYPNLQFQWLTNRCIAGPYLWGVAACLLVLRFLTAMGCEAYSFGSCALIGCVAVGILFGQRIRTMPHTK